MDVYLKLLRLKVDSACTLLNHRFSLTDGYFHLPLFIYIHVMI